MNNLGFGMMRLPVNHNDPTDFNYDELNKMVDAFLNAGFTYFDTSYVYHNGKSQEAVRKAVVERKPRDSFTVATKFPTFNNVPEDQIETIFQSQLDDLGVEYIDYYLLHNIQTVLYDGIDGKGGIVKSTHLFDHAKKWKEEGKIKNLGFSFHSSAKLLDRILTEHPEVDFVQIALNPIDWTSQFVQAKQCYETIVKHGKKVVIMEMVKGGGLSHLPQEAEKILKERAPEDSITSWSLRFALDLDHVIAVLSGMSTLAQVEDNIATTKAAKPLSKEDHEALRQAMTIYRNSAPIDIKTLDTYKDKKWHNVSARAILEAYSICLIQPDPGFSDDNNYFKNTLAEENHEDLAKAQADSDDPLINEAVEWLKEHSF